MKDSVKVKIIVVLLLIVGFHNVSNINKLNKLEETIPNNPYEVILKNQETLCHLMLDVRWYQRTEINLVLSDDFDCLGTSEVAYSKEGYTATK